MSNAKENYSNLKNVTVSNQSANHYIKELEKQNETFMKFAISTLNYFGNINDPEVTQAIKNILEKIKQKPIEEILK